ncbi:MAG TPA: efflux RND transporter periplasmic adaptor subunit [Polyangiales bacterium]|nr:efflux RND transporter periplasmic adaptor subunit [Polyangiales bacterium]
MLRLAVSFAICSAFTAGCSVSSASPAAPAAPPPVEVTVTTLHPRDAALSLRYVGRVAAFRDVEVRARVAGALVDRHYTEGSAVRAGELLFRIDPATYASERARADAQLEQQRATYEQAASDDKLARTLFETGTVTSKRRDDAASNLAKAKAGVSAAEAALNGSKLALGYTTVFAPISGVTSVEALPKGSLVSVGTLLTRVRTIDTVFVEFAFGTEELAEVRRLIGQSDLRAAHLPARVTFSNGETYEPSGFVDFVESGVDRTTGTVRARAIFPNPSAKLIPGDFVRISLGGAKKPGSIVVPDKALLQTVQGRFAYVVGAGDKAEIRPVTLGREVDGGWMVEKGLSDGDRVIVEGVIKIRPGTPVKAHDLVTAPGGAT